jgi:hypothetical protein
VSEQVRRPVVRAELTGEHVPVSGRSAEVARRSAEDDARRSRRGAAEQAGGHRPVVGDPVVGESIGGRSADSASASVTPSEGRRRAAEPAAAESGGRRRAEEHWDSWEDGPKPSGRRSAPEPAEPAGAHADGKSVSELLAAFGGADSPRRRRRRED